MSSPVEVQTEGRTRIITLNRPDKLNSLDASTVDALTAEIETANASDARLLVLKGAGRSFCAGFDLSRLDEQSEAELLLRFVRIELLLQAICNSPALTLALAHGKVFGAGVDLVAACRYRVATEDTLFRMPGLKFGLVLGTRRFAALVGHEVARRVLEDTSSFDGRRAYGMGFVQEVAETGSWDAIIAKAATRASSLDDDARQDLYRTVSTLEPDKDLATLVRSAARPGLKERLMRYAAR